jgi:hypothetical protein
MDGEAMVAAEGQEIGMETIFLVLRTARPPSISQDGPQFGQTRQDRIRRLLLDRPLDEDFQLSKALVRNRS